MTTPPNVRQTASGEDTADKANREPAKSLPPEELEAKLQRHQVWLDSNDLMSKGQADLAGFDLSNVDLSGRNLDRAHLRKCNLTGSNLSGTKLRGANLNSADLTGANLFAADLEGARLLMANLRRADFQHANLDGANLNRATLDEAYLFRASLRAAKLNSASLRSTNFNGADLRSASVVNADLRCASLVATDLEQTDLSQARLQGANMHTAKAQYASFSHADFDTAASPKPANSAEAKGSNADLGPTDLSEACLQHANLGDACLVSVAGLQSHQLGGADLSNASLPADIGRFEGLRHVEELSKHARGIFLALIGGCLFSWLTIATTTDAALLTKAANTPLPIIQTKVPIAGFFLAAPAILLALYFYLHIYLQDLWESLASLPARFPDGRTLEQRAYPWLLSNIVRTYVPLLAKSNRPFVKARTAFSITAAWGLVPCTLTLFWFRYLPSHDWLGMALLTVILLLAIWSGHLFYQRAASVLRANPDPPRRVTPGPAVPVVVHVGLVAGAILVVAMTGQTRPELELFGYRLYANLQDAELSGKPSHWTGTGDNSDLTAQIAAVIGSDLAGDDLRLAYAPGAFLVRADLAGADLLYANLQGADLRGADLSGTNLRGADLRQSKLGFHTRADPAFGQPRDDGCQQLTKAVNWHLAHRDEAMACGESIPGFSYQARPDGRGPIPNQ